MVVLAVVIALMLASVACAGGQSAPTPDIDATAEARVEQEVVAQLAATAVAVVEEVTSTTPEPIPTNALVPTNTLMPAPTDTPEPTFTAVPTDTQLPKPTDTPEPTFTPAPSPLELMWNQRVGEAFAKSDCPPGTEVELGASDYKGPLFDTHFHTAHLWNAPLRAGMHSDRERYERSVLRGDTPRYMPILGMNITMTEIACQLEREGTDRAHAFFLIESERPGQLRPYLEVVRRTMELYPTRFVPFISVPCCNETAPTVDARTLSEYLEIYPGLFRGLGEIVLYDQPREGGGRKAEDWPPDAPRLLDVYQVAREHELLVWMHPGEGHQDSLERVLKQHPDLTFIVHGQETERNIANLMEKYSNIYFSINDLYGKEYPVRKAEDKSRFLGILGDGDYEPLIERDLATWQALIERYPDRFMWATDRGNVAGLWTYDADVGQILVDYARAFIGRLDPEVQERFAYKNAQSLLKD